MSYMDSLIALCFFIVLFVTHILCIKIGWKMGIKTDRVYTPMEKPKEYPRSKPYIDELTEERLDYE